MTSDIAADASTCLGSTRLSNGSKLTGIGLAIAALGACATPPAPPAPPAPPPVEVIPARPTPPGGATVGMMIPPVGADGVRQTVNAGISQHQALWNVRSGLNVAALNCRGPKHAGLVENYTNFLKTHKSQLADTNSRLAREYRAKHGTRKGRNVQDAYQTRVYNYFALPPALPAFCDEALAISRDAQLVQKGDLQSFTATALPRMEGVFDSFYRAYEQYEADVAAWDAKYGSQQTASATRSTGPTQTTTSAGTNFVSQPVVQTGSGDGGGGE